jgi:predicted hydrocarbon binding protein
MQNTISILVSKRQGLLAQIVAALVGEGCKLLRQAVSQADDPTLQRFTLTVEGPEATVQNLPRLLLRFGDVESQAHGAAATAAASAPPVDVEAAMGEIVAAFPDVAERVRGLARSLPAASRSETLSSLGERLGRREYQRSYALGSPLKLEHALRRMVLPAVRQLARVELEGSVLRVSECPFCAASRAEPPGCDFLVGFVRGLLHAAPATAGAMVREARCRAAGGPYCELEFLAS